MRLPITHARGKRGSLSSERYKAIKFLLSQTYQDSKKAEVISLIEINIPVLRSEWRFGWEYRYPSHVPIEKAEVLSDSYGRGSLQRLKEVV